MIYDKMKSLKYKNHAQINVRAEVKSHYFIKSNLFYLKTRFVRCELL